MTSTPLSRRLSRTGTCRPSCHSRSYFTSERDLPDPSTCPRLPVFIGRIMLRSELELALKGSRPIYLPLLSNNHDGVLVVWRTLPVTDEMRAGIAEYPAEAESLAPPEPLNMKGDPGLASRTVRLRQQHGRAFHPRYRLLAPPASVTRFDSSDRRLELV
jgi:hypothetical protein